MLHSSLGTMIGELTEADASPNRMWRRARWDGRV